MLKGPTPREGWKPRETGDYLTPENATPRATTTRDGGKIRPEGTQARISGDPMSNTMPTNTVDPVAVGPMGDSGTQSPFGQGFSKAGDPVAGKNIDPLK